MNEFDDLTDLDDVFGPLRSAARPAELSQENATVDLMVEAHRTSEGKHMFTSRRARIATLVATGVLGFGGMAAASPSLGGDEPVEVPVVGKTVVVQQDESTDTDEDESVDDPADINEVIVDEVIVDKEEVDEDVEDVEDARVAEIETVEVVTVDVVSALDPNLDTAFNESFCVVPGSHGKTVSAVARFLARGELDPFFAGYPGDLTVKMAAQSSCGKNKLPEVEEPEFEENGSEKPEVQETEPEETEPEVEVEEPEVEDSEAKADRPDKSDKGAEKAANGNGNGKANRNGNGNGKLDD